MRDFCPSEEFQSWGWFCPPHLREHKLCPGLHSGLWVGLKTFCLNFLQNVDEETGNIIPCSEKRGQGLGGDREMWLEMSFSRGFMALLNA